MVACVASSALQSAVTDRHECGVPQGVTSACVTRPES